MPDQMLRALTWNLWWRFGPRWRDRQHPIRETIARFDPDVVALQEVWATAHGTQADELAEAFGLEAVFASPSYPLPPAAPARSGNNRTDESTDGVDLGIAVLSRWPVIDQRVVAMPARHRSWDPVALVVRLAHPAGPLPVVVTCLEYGVAYTDDRIAQGALMADLATDPRLDGPCPVLLMGDLNAAAGSPTLRAVGDVLVDAWLAGGGDPGAVTLPSTHPSAPLEAGPELVDQRIDHVFFRAGHEDQRVIVEGVHLAGDAVDGVLPSDHRGVVVDLRWRN